MDICTSTEVLEGKLRYCSPWAAGTGLYECECKCWAGASPNHACKRQVWKIGFGKQTIPPVLLSQSLNDADSQPCFLWLSRGPLIYPTSVATLVSTSKRDHELTKFINFQDLLSMNGLVNSLMICDNSAFIFIIQEWKFIESEKQEGRGFLPFSIPQSSFLSSGLTWCMILQKAI